jgi:Glycosyltransferase family 87
VIGPRPRAFAGLLLVCAGLLVIASVGDLRQQMALYLTCWALAVAGYLLLVSAPRSLPLWVVVGAALLLGLALLPRTPSLSDDIYRYVWDGRVQLAGHNPYLQAPASSTLNDVFYAQRDLVNHPGVRTIYPPVAELIFAAVALVGGGLVALKLLMGLTGLLTAGALALLAPPERRREAVTLYLLCPLVIQETWGSGHVEIVAVLFAVLAAALLARGRDGWAGLSLGLGAAVKLTPAALLIPALIGGRAKPGRLIPAFVAAFALPYVPYLLTGGALGSLQDTGARPMANPSLFGLLDLVLPYRAAVAVAAALFIAGAVLLARRLRGRALTAPAFAWAATLFVLLLPVAQPWYWLTPLALGIAAGVLLPLFLGLAAPLGYAAIAYPGFRRWVPLVTYLPLLTLLPGLVRWIDRRRHGRSDQRRTERRREPQGLSSGDPAGRLSRGLGGGLPDGDSGDSARRSGAGGTSVEYP